MHNKPQRFITQKTVYRMENDAGVNTESLQNALIGSFYNFPTIIEPFNVQYRVVGQNGSLSVPLFYGTYAECVKWRSENCRQLPALRISLHDIT